MLLHNLKVLVGIKISRFLLLCNFCNPAIPTRSNPDHTLSHDQVTRFLSSSKFSPSELWEQVAPHIQDHADSFVIVDDSVQDKRYARFIELAKVQYSGNVHGLVNGINLVNMVHSNGIDGEIDYRIYHPSTDGKTKNDHFREMFARLITHKNLKAKKILFDTWYASMENL